jgi:hypothetical protein
MAVDSNRAGPSGTLEIETSLNKYIKFQGQVSDDSNGQLNLVWKRDY